MPTLLAQIAPQRSTQYSALASALAPHELSLSVLSATIREHTTVTLGGQSYVRCELNSWPSDDDWRDLGLPAMTSAFFEARNFDGAMWLRPIDLPFQPALPLDLMTTRRYKGKTNEAFTHFMLNVARFSSAFAREPWRNLRVFDPLCGGGTTLFAALALGAHAAGVEQGKDDVETTTAFVALYAREQAIPCSAREERLKKFGRRWWFELGPSTGSGLKQQCIIARGDTLDSVELMAGVKKPHLIVTDLPYGIQHRGELAQLIGNALPVWASWLAPGGAIAMAWDSTRFPRTDMLAVLAGCGLNALNHAPYDQLAHRVDRVIKQRDVVVLTSSPTLPPKGEGVGR